MKEPDENYKIQYDMPHGCWCCMNAFPNESDDFLFGAYCSVHDELVCLNGKCGSFDNH